MYGTQVDFSLCGHCGTFWFIVVSRKLAYRRHVCIIRSCDRNVVVVTIIIFHFLTLRDSVVVVIFLRALAFLFFCWLN